MKVCPKCRTIYLNNEPFCAKDGEKTSAAESTADQEELIGTSVGNYKITSLLGEGGMGKVYRAEHPALGRTVAIKVLNLEYARRIESVERFFLEAKAINKIGHDNIIDVLDFGQLPEGSPYYVMEFLQGSTLTEFIEKYAPIPFAVASEIMYPVLIALQAAHEEGIIHRDLKPDNIFLAEKKRGVRVVKLLDFGVAKLIDTKATNYKTRTGAIVGTPFYMSPEQVLGGDIEIDARADVYAAGLIFYELITGKPPFDGKTVLDIFQKRLTENPIPPKQHRPELPEALNKLLLESIARDRKNRTTSAEEFAKRLEEIAQKNSFALKKALVHDNNTASFPALSALKEKEGTPMGAFREQKTTPLAPSSVDPNKTTLTRSTGEIDPAPPKSKKYLLAAAGAVATGLVVIFGVSSGATPKPNVQTVSPSIVVTPPPTTQIVEPATQEATTQETTQTNTPTNPNEKKADPKLDPKKNPSGDKKKLQQKLDKFIKP